MGSQPDNPGAGADTAADVAAAAAAHRRAMASRKGNCGRARQTPDHNIYHPQSLRLSIINWWHVACLYVQPAAVAILVCALALAVSRGTFGWSSLATVWSVIEVCHALPFAVLCSSCPPRSQWNCAADPCMD